MGRIVWIASYPLSGETWLRVFLAHLVGAPRTATGKLDLASIATPENAAAHYQPFLRRPIAEASAADMARVRPMVQRAIAARAEGFAFVQTHAALVTHLGTPTVTFDATASAIYLVRNPLDLAAWSWRVKGGSVDDAITLLNLKGRLTPRGDTACQPIGSWSENVGSWTSRRHDRLLVLRFEDLVDDPAAGFAKIVEFLHVDANAQAIGKATDQSIASLLDSAGLRGGGDGFAGRDALRSAMKDRWKSDLTTRQIADVMRPNHELMRRFNYVLT